MKLTPIVAIICITGLEIVALTADINGAIFGIAITAIAGLGGYEIRVLQEKKKEKK